MASTGPYCLTFSGRVAKGWTVRVRVCLIAGGSTAPTGTALLAYWDGLTPLINALSDATFAINSAGLVAVSELSYGASGETDNAEDSAVFNFSTFQGNVAKISIPAPKDSIFLADNQTVNPADTDVAAFVTYILNSGSTEIGTAGTRGGAEFNTFLGAIRVRKRTRRKYNIWVRDPTVSIPGI